MGLPLDASCNAIYSYMNKLTKLVKIIPCEVGNGDLLAPATAKIFFDHVICSYRVPIIMLHDMDPRFISRFWTALFELLGSHVVFSSVFHPQTDG